MPIFDIWQNDAFALRYLRANGSLECNFVSGLLIAEVPDFKLLLILKVATEGDCNYA